MSHLPPLIIDLAIILGAAAFSTILFSKLKQPVVLGYLIAGFLVGPHFALSPTVVETESVKVWAEIGVIFLLFGLGLEFSFKKLAKVGRSASISAIFEIITMLIVGYVFGRAVGWNSMDSIFLGAILSMSSTTIIIRAFDEAGLKGRGFVGLVFGILIVEDLIAILLMVILAAISVPGSFSGLNMLFLSARLGFFLLLWFVLGIYILPTALKKIRRYLTNEIMLVVSIGLCLLMVILATKAEFSAALGAFIMGAILAETEEGARIEHLIHSVKDLFAAVFFVSVGMLIDPAILREHFGIVLMITAITIIGKLFGSGLGALLSGRSLKQSVQAGMSLAQIGEFSFIIATLGMTLKVTSDFLYPIVIAVSAVTTFTTPYMIRYSGKIFDVIETRLPKKLLDRLKQYEVAMSVDSKEGALSLIWRIYGVKLLLNSVVVIALALASEYFLLPKLLEILGDQTWVRLVAAVVVLGASLPFLWAIIMKIPSNLSDEQAETVARLRSLHLGVLFVRALLGIALIIFVIDRVSSSYQFQLVAVALVITWLFAFRRFIEPAYLRMEKRFLGNLNAKEMQEVDQISHKSSLAPWDTSLADFVVSSDSKVAGQTLEEANLRGTTGTMAVMITRGKRHFFAPGKESRILPNDRIYLIGTDEQISRARLLLEDQGVEGEPSQGMGDLFNLENIVLNERSPYINKSIRDCGLREAAEGLIVGIERDGIRMLNPDSATILQAGDLVWLVGQRPKIQEIRRDQKEAILAAHGEA